MAGDVHYTSRPPAGRSDTYPTEAAQLLEQFNSLADRLRVDARLQVGDLFHSKGNTTHREVAALTGHLQSPIPLGTIVGNHDMQGNNTLNAFVDQPYAVLCQSGTIRDLTCKPLVLSSFEVVVAGVPFGTKPRDAVPYLEVQRAVEQCGGKPSAIVVLTHDEMTPDGSMGVHGVNLVRQLIAVYGCPVAVCNGHLHVDPSATYVLADNRIGGWFVNTGTLCRTSISDSDIAAATLIDYDFSRPKATALQVQQLPLRNLPRDQAFIATTAAGPSPSASLDDFVAALNSDAGQGMDPLVFVRSIAAARGSSPEAVAKAVQIIGEVR